MRIHALCFFAGILCICLLRSLPSLQMLLLCIFILSVLIIFSYRFRVVRFVVTFLLGFLYVIWRADMIAQWQLPLNLESKNVIVQGWIVSIPSETQIQSSFVISTNEINNQKISTRIRLTWRNTHNHLRVGDHWQLMVRMKRIHGLMNPGGTDYEAYAFIAGIRAHGYIVDSEKNILLKHETHVAWLNQWRQRLKDKIELILPKSKTSAWIVALLMGERSAIPAEQWQVLRNTGTNHLMAIAGLHIGFISGFIFIFVKFLWSRSSRICCWLPATHAAAIASWVAGILYATISGFSLPARRACVMLSVFILSTLMRRKLSVWQAYFLALWTILILDPLSILSISFWLSMVSVFWIIVGVSGRVSPHGLWWKYGRIQWVITLGLIPLTIILFQQYSFLSLLANLIAVPWMGFLILPFILIGFLSLYFSLKWAGFFFYCADQSLSTLWSILNFFSHLPYAAIAHQVSSPILIFAGTLGILLLLMPRGFPHQWLGFFFVIIFLWPRYPVIAKGDIHFTVLDVGQGLAAVLQTQNHLLVFDTGLRLGSDYDMGEIVMTPFLQMLRAHKIDLLVLSHGDNDHVGGAKALTQNFSVAKIMSGQPERIHLPNVLQCSRDQSWDWDDVHFAFLSPQLNSMQEGNDLSCVLKVMAHGKSILLTGDIEKKAERFLLQNPEQLSADILIAPHHGSKTSGLPAFIAAVHPHWVVFAVGYRNRFHFPNPIVQQKYRAIGAMTLATDQAGAITFSIHKKEIQPVLYREEHRHVWSSL